MLNDALAGLIDHEQAEAQKVFPHYFERYVTDGVDFNIYIGQSLLHTKIRRTISAKHEDLATRSAYKSRRFGS